MISLPKNLEVTFLAEKKELACRGLSQVASLWRGRGESNLAPRVQAGDPTTRPDPHGPWFNIGVPSVNPKMGF